MGLLENEKWEDYMDGEVYVTANSGMSGFLATLRDFDHEHVVVEDKNGNEHTLNHEHVYGTWVLEDW